MANLNIEGVKKEAGKYFSFILIVLLFSALFLPLVASADGTGEENVHVKDKDGNDISKDNIDKSDNDEPHPSDNDEEAESKEDTATVSTITNMDAGQAMIENAGINLSYRIGDEFLKGGFKIASIGVENKKVADSNTMTYSLYSKELKPFSQPSVRKTVILTYLFHVAVALTVIFLGVCRYVSQTVSPKKTTKIMAGFSGEYSQFDVFTFLILCCGVIAMPIVDFLGIGYCLLVRNGVAEMMTARTLDILGSTTDSLPTYLLVNASWYFNNLEKVFGEYAIGVMCRLIVIKSWVQAGIVLIGSLTQAALTQAFIMIGFLLVLSMDILTLFFVSSGIDDSVYTGNWGHTLSGMVTAAAVDALILISLLIIPFLILYARIRSGRFGGKA